MENIEFRSHLQVLFKKYEIEVVEANQGDLFQKIQQETIYYMWKSL